MIENSDDECEAKEVGGGADVAQPPPSRRVIRERALMATTLLLAIALALAITGYIHERNRAGDSQKSADSAKTALATATVVAKEFTTYDYKTLARDFALARTGLAPSFAKEYDQTTKQLAQTLTQYQASSTSVVKDVAVVSAGGGKATVIAFVDQTIANSTAKQPQTDRIRMELTLVGKGSSWLVSNIALI